jgi:hypothetical protein
VLVLNFAVIAGFTTLGAAADKMVAGTEAKARLKVRIARFRMEHIDEHLDQRLALIPGPRLEELLRRDIDFDEGRVIWPWILARWRYVLPLSDRRVLTWTRHAPAGGIWSWFALS